MTFTRPYLSHVAGRTPGSGPVVAVLTDHPADMAVAAAAAGLAAGLAAGQGTLLVVAPAVHGGAGFVRDVLLPPARTRSLRADSIAIAGRVTPILHTAGVAWMRSTLVLPAGTDALRALPVHPLLKLVDRFSAVAVVTALPLHDPTGLLRPVHSHASTGAAGERHAIS
jgi:hypothetical protein